MTVRPLAAAALLLSGCATYTAHEARSALLGMNQNDLLACAGTPDRKQRLDDHEVILDYDYTSDTAAFSLEVLMLGTLSLGPRGQCKAIFRMQDGIVTHVAYASTTYSLDGPLGACGPIVQECMQNRQHTLPAAGYDPMSIAVR